jgi:hypothetical protein
MTDASFGQKFHNARLLADLSVKEACDLLHRGENTIKRIETDKPIHERTRVRAEWVLQQMTELGEKMRKTGGNRLPNT